MRYVALYIITSSILMDYDDSTSFNDSKLPNNILPLFLTCSTQHLHMFTQCAIGSKLTIIAHNVDFTAKSQTER